MTVRCRPEDRRCWALTGAWCLALLLIPSAADAQVLIALLLGDKLSTDRFQLGVNVSAAMVGFGGVEGKPRLDYSLGIYGEISLSKHFRLMPELLMKSPGGARTMSPSVAGYPFAETGDATIDNLVTTGSVSQKLTYLALPVSAEWVHGPIGLGLGPQFGVLVRGKTSVTEKTNGDDLTLSTDSLSGLRRWDLGIVGSVEWVIAPEKEMRSMRVRAKGYCGLVDIVESNPDTPIRNWYVMLGLDIPIGGPPPKKDSADEKMVQTLRDDAELSPSRSTQPPESTAIPPQRTTPSSEL